MTGGNLYSSYNPLFVAVDCVIFGYNIASKELELLLVKRNFNPMKGHWSLAGGFVEPDEELDAAANRVLKNLTGIDNVFMRQLHCFGKRERDTEARVVSVAYWALIKVQDLDQLKAKENGAHWRSLDNLPNLIFDHADMIAMALKSLQIQVKIKPIGFELLPEKFTLVQLLDLYEAIHQRQVDKRNFRKKLLSMDILEKLDEKDKETSKKGAFYYRFIYDRYKLLKDNGLIFELDVN